jgi:hypothetical protein
MRGATMVSTLQWLGNWSPVGLVVLDPEPTQRTAA